MWLIKSLYLAKHLHVLVNLNLFASILTHFLSVKLQNRSFLRNFAIEVNTVNTGVSVSLLFSALRVCQLVHQIFILVPVLEREEGDNLDDKVD